MQYGRKDGINLLLVGTGVFFMRVSVWNRRFGSFHRDKIVLTGGKPITVSASAMC